MAVDPTKAKRDINFDTFAPEKEGSRINWFEQANVISDAVTNAANKRQKRKDDINEDTKTNLDALNELESLDNKTLMDMTIDGSNDAANVIYQAEQAMQRGELRPQDFQKIKNNISSGFTQFQKNAKSWDEDFKRYTERMNGNPELGQSSSLEQYLGERMESFGNLKNLQLVTNPETGMLAFGRVDPETGELLTGPDDLISMNRMTAISKQEINEYDVGGFITQASEELGSYITAGNASTMGKDGTGPRAVLTIEDFMQTPEAEKYIADKAAAAMSSNYEIGSILADNGIKNDLGELFRGGDQKQFDQWNIDNPDDAANNPIIVMGYKENGVQVEPALTDDQRQKAQGFLEDSLKAKLGYKETLTTKQVVQPRAKSNYEIAKGDEEKTYSNLVDVVDKLISGDEKASSAAATELSNSINSRMSNDKNFKPVQLIERVGDQFVVTKKGDNPIYIDAIDSNGEDLSGDEIGSKIWKLVTGGKVSFSDAKGDQTLGDRNKTDARGTQTNVAQIENADYNSKIRIDGKDDDVQTFVDDITDIGAGWDETTEEVAPQYSNILQEVFKTSTTPGLIAAFKGDDINVKADGKTLIFKIGDMTFKYPNDMVDWKEGQDASDDMWDKSETIWPAMQDFISEAIAQKKTGKKYKKEEETTNAGDNILEETTE